MSLSPLVEDPSAAQPAADSGPLPLSLPAILRNPKPAIPAHLHQPQRAHHHGRTMPASAKPVKRVEGRRARLRRENDALAFNPHAYPPTRSEIATLYLPTTKPTFPSPLPAHLLPRTRPAPSPPLPTPDAHSGEAGRYGMSLTGVRRQLRSKGPRAESLVKLVEDTLEGWVTEVRRSVVLLPARQSRERRVVDPFLVGRDGQPQVEAIVEVGRGSASLIWEVGASFERFVVHCVARHHNLVSFSKPTADGKRQTHILLPPSRSARRPAQLSSAGALDTPPTTDLSSMNGSGTDTDAAPAPVSQAYGGHWGSWDSEAESESEHPARLVPLIRSLALDDGGAVNAHAAPEVESDGAPHQSYDDDETSDDESVSSAALSSLSNSLAHLPPLAGAGADHRLLPHRPERPSPAFVPTPAAETDSEAEDADRTFTPASFAGGPTASGLPAKDVGPPRTGSFWEYVYM